MKKYNLIFNFGNFKDKKTNEFSIQILTGEDWNVVMYDGIQAYGGIKVYNNYRAATLSQYLSVCPSAVKNHIIFNNKDKKSRFSIMVILTQS